MPTKQENGALADKGLASELERLVAQRSEPARLMRIDHPEALPVAVATANRIDRSIAECVENNLPTILAALSAQPAGDATDAEGMGISAATSRAIEQAIKAVRETAKNYWPGSQAAKDAKRAEALIETLRTPSQPNDAAGQSEIERLREALSFYADPEEYHAIGFAFDRPCGGFADDFDEDHGHEDYDRPMPGKRARAALSETRP